MVGRLSSGLLKPFWNPLKGGKRPISRGFSTGCSFFGFCVSLRQVMRSMDSWLQFFSGHQVALIPWVSLPIEHPEKKGSWLFRVYRGWDTAQLYGDYFINYEIRIPSLNSQYSMESKAVGELVVGKLYTSFTSPELWYHHAYCYITICTWNLKKDV